MISILAYKRRLWILLVPFINFIFLFLFVFSPSSLPRLPRRFSLITRTIQQEQQQQQQKGLPIVTKDELPPGSFEHITFHKNPPSQADGPAADASTSTSDGSRGQVGGESGGSAEGGASGSGYNYLLQQRKLVEHIKLTPLPQHLITTYRPGYLLSHSQDSEGSNNTTTGKDTSAIEDLPPSPPATFPHRPSHQGGHIQELTTSDDQENINNTSNNKGDKHDNNVRNRVDENSTSKEQQQLQEEYRINMDPTTKYLTFLPHSGFHNQRTELENALLLARLLNRTLIMPKVYLGPPMPWLSFSMLHSRLLYQTKIGLEHCRAIIESQLEVNEDGEDEQEEEETTVVGGVVEGQEQKEQSEHQQQQGHHHHHHHHHHHSHPEQPMPPVPRAPTEAPTHPKDVASGQDAMAAQVVIEPISDLGMPTEPAIQDGTQAGGALADESVVAPDKEEEREYAVGPDSERGVQLISEPTLDQEILSEVTTSDMEAEAGNLGEESEVEVGLGEEEVEEEEEEAFQSWIEEPEDDDQDRVRIATGDGDLGNIMDLEDGLEEGEEEEEEEEGSEGFDQIKDWSQTASDGGDEEEGFAGEAERRQRQQRQQQGGYGKGEYQRLQLGILDDDEDDEATQDQDDDFDWRPDFYTLPQDQRYRDGRSQQQQRRVRGRLLSQQMDVDGAALPLYLPAPERPIDRRSGLRLKKRYMPAEPPLEVTTAAGAQVEAAAIEPDMPIVEAKNQKQRDPDSAQLEKRQLVGQYAFQQQQPQQHPTPPNIPSPSAIAAAAKAAKKTKASRPIPWSPLPAECLQYESWTMTDWDLFFNLDPLRHHVRILTRESMSMAYLESQFNITFLKPEEQKSPQGSSNSTAEAKTGVESSSPSGGEGKANGDAESYGDEAEKGDSESDHGGEEGKDEGDSDNDTDESEKPKPPLLRSEADVLFFDDTSLYDYRFSQNPDSPESQKTRSKFLQEFTIDWLAQRPERLLHLGSIFGTGRVAIDSLDSKAWLQMIRDHLIIRTEILQVTSQSIADKISGRVEGEDRSGGGGLGEGKDPMEAGFVGIHIRMSDGHFSLTARDTIENIRQELMWQIGMDDPTSSPVETDHADNNSGMHPHKKQARLSIEQCRARALNHRRALQEQLLQQQHERDRERELGHPPMKPPTPNQQQQQSFMELPADSPTSQSPPPKRRSNGRYTPIYLATDAHRPRSNPIFDNLFATFDCIFTLDDFSEDLEKLTQYRNPEDGTLMAKFLIPMVDAMVVAKAAAFFGTPASTFSNYIQKQLRPAYTGLYD